MIQNPPIGEEDVRALATEQSFERGYDYYRNGMVFNLSRRGDLLAAEVEGSGYEPYWVEVTLGETGVDRMFCNCPYDGGGICKHIVAVLLTLIHDDAEIEEKPTLEALLADLTAAQLRQLILGAAAGRSNFVEAIEREAARLEERPDAATDTTQTAVPVDLAAVRREIYKDFRLAETDNDPFKHGYYDEYAALEVDFYSIVAPHLQKVEDVLDAGDVEAAVTLIMTIIDAYADGLNDLEDYIYDYNEDAMGDTVFDLGAALAEVLLSWRMAPKEQEEWLAQIDRWENQLGDLSVARTAVEHGWTYPPLVAAMEGQITDKGAWEGEAPYYADQLALVRLSVLEREGRRQAYINLAAAEGQTALSVAMLAESGEAEKAVAKAKAYLPYPSMILSVAKALAAQEAMDAALEVAEHGLTLEQEQGLVDLARWTRQQAEAAGREELALRAAQVAFREGMTLADYMAVQQSAGDQWPDIKPTLLPQLEKRGFISHKIEIYLHEEMLQEAMAVMDERGVFTSDADLHRVVEATRDTTPDWGIGKYQEKAEAIMDAGKAKSYDTAVSWLRRAREIYQQQQRLADWRRYLDDLLETHHRKYKLVPMLRQIR